jgi:hypothetical protein
MPNAKPTPGPWTPVTGDGQFNRGRAVYKEGTAIPIASVAGQYGGPHEWDANTRLIAAAPELRDALAALLATALKVDDIAWANGVTRAGTTRPCDAAAAILAKLEG